MNNNTDNLKVFTCNANPKLADEISSYLGIELGKSHVQNFSDGETNITIDDSVRGCDVFIVQSTCAPVNVSLRD